MDIFYHLANLTSKKIFPDFSLEEVDKSYVPYMINRWLSMNEVFIPIVQLVNQNKNLPKEQHYRFLFNLLPQTYIRFNYLKKKKNELEDEKRELLMKHFDFGKNDLECLLSIYSEEQIQKILDKYQSGKVR